jgi:hypothetical protein
MVACIVKPALAGLGLFWSDDYDVSVKGFSTGHIDAYITGLGLFWSDDYDVSVKGFSTGHIDAMV